MAVDRGFQSLMRTLEQELEDESSFDRLLEREEELEAESFHGFGEQETPPLSCPKDSSSTVSGFSRYANTVQALPPDQQNRLTEISRTILRSFQPGCHPVHSVSLVGHADRDVQRGTAFERRISSERALAVQRRLQALLGNNPAASHIEWKATGVGASALVVPSPSSERERARNRRVDISLSTADPDVDRWDHAVEENHRLEKTLAWQAFRSSIVQLLGFTKSLPDEYAFAAAVARWQKGQPNLPADGIIGPNTLKRMNTVLRSTPPAPAQAELPNTSFHKLELDPSELRRLQREVSHETEGGESFATDPIPILSKDGHSNLTRKVAQSFRELTSQNVDALVEGSRRPDKDPPTLVQQTDECQQRRHCLRGRLCQEVDAALRDIRGHLAKLYRDAFVDPNQPNFELLGEALHLIQDSYSPAHTEREQFMGPPYLGPIIYVRVWNPISPGFPTEHGYPADMRDSLDLLTATGVAAVTASREFLQMAVERMKAPGSPANQVKFDAYGKKHLGLSSTNQTIAAIIRLAVRPFDPDPRYASYLKCLAPDRPKRC